MQVTRTFSHRSYGQIGTASLSVDKGKWTLDGQPLPDNSVEHLMTFALQSLQDAYAGAGNADEAQAAFAKKRQRIIDGTLGARAAGGGEEPHMPFVRRIIRAALGADSKAAYEAIGSDDKKARTAFLNERFAGLDAGKRAKVEAAAKEQYEADAATRRLAKTATSGLTI